MQISRAVVHAAAQSLHYPLSLLTLKRLMEMPSLSLCPFLGVQILERSLGRVFRVAFRAAVRRLEPHVLHCRTAEAIVRIVMHNIVGPTTMSLTCID